MTAAAEGPEPMIEVGLDRDECCASGMCASIAPEAFEIDAHGFAVVLDGASSTPIDVLVRAAKSCPTMCISLRRGDDEIDLFS